MDISLALGGGGSRGYSHIGVLRRLEKLLAPLSSRLAMFACIELEKQPG